MNCCPKEVVGFVKERKSRSLGEVTESAERYVFAHGLHTFSSNPRSDTCRSQSNNVNRSQTPKQGQKPVQQSYVGKSSPGESVQSGARQSTGFGQFGYYRCGSPDHIKRNCPMMPHMQSAQAMSLGQTGSIPSENVKRDATSLPTDGAGFHGPIGTLRSDNDAPDGRAKSVGQIGTSAGCILVGRPVNVLHVTGGYEVEKPCRACDDIEKVLNQMPIVSGRLLPEGKSVSVLRDSGSSTCVVKTGLVSNEQYTGAVQSVRLIDGTLRRFPVARVRVDSPYFCGEVDVVCMPNSLVDVVIGNVEGARGPGDPNLQYVSVGNVQVTQDSHSKGPDVIVESQGEKGGSNEDLSSGCVGRGSIPCDNGKMDAAGETARDVEAVDEDVRSRHA